MTIAEAMVAEFSQESQGTRKMLERLPEDKLSWKPHDRSMSLGALATHIAHIPEWAQTIVNDDELDLSSIDHKLEERTTGRHSLKISTRTSKSSRRRWREEAMSTCSRAGS